jgi:hypothetical protein
MLVPRLSEHGVFSRVVRIHISVNVHVYLSIPVDGPLPDMSTWKTSGVNCLFWS